MSCLSHDNVILENRDELIMISSCFAARFQILANVYLKRYPGLKINIEAELAYYKVRLMLNLIHRSTFVIA